MRYVIPVHLSLTRIIIGVNTRTSGRMLDSRHSQHYNITRIILLTESGCSSRHFCDSTIRSIVCARRSFNVRTSRIFRRDRTRPESLFPRTMNSFSRNLFRLCTTWQDWLVRSTTLLTQRHLLARVEPQSAMRLFFCTTSTPL